MEPKISFGRSACLVALFTLLTVGFRLAVQDPLNPDWTTPASCKRIGDRMVC